MNERLLYLVPARLGDAVMLTPALARLKQLRPDFDLDVLAATAMSAGVYRNNPSCHRIYIFSEVTFNAEFVSSYDFLVAPHRDVKILEMSERCRKPILLTELGDPNQVQARQTLNFINRLFAHGTTPPEPAGYQLFPGDAEFEYASSLLGNGTHYIGMHLGCHGLNRRRALPWRKKTQHEKVWPLKSIVSFASRFKQEHAQYQFMLTGGDNEQHLAHEFMKRVPDTINLVGKTDVLQLAALMRGLSAYVCGDTGTMHVACAMNVPLVALFGQTNVLRTGPYPEASFRRVIKCDDLAHLSPEVVLGVVNDLLRPGGCEAAAARKMRMSFPT
ncbi:MAG: glycosyltransferase family 9 protein [Burkholderiales bacterium]